MHCSCVQYGMHEGMSQSAGFVGLPAHRPWEYRGALRVCLACVQYGMHEGTSQSAGFVAGAAALLLAAYRAAGLNATGAMMKSPIMSGALPSAQLKSRCKAGAGLPSAQQPRQLQCS